MCSSNLNHSSGSSRVVRGTSIPILVSNITSEISHDKHIFLTALEDARSVHTCSWLCVLRLQFSIPCCFIIIAGIFFCRGNVIWKSKSIEIMYEYFSRDQNFVSCYIRILSHSVTYVKFHSVIRNTPLLSSYAFHDIINIFERNFKFSALKIHTLNTWQYTV